MIYHTIKDKFMKKISDFIPQKIVNKKNSIDSLNMLLANNTDESFAHKVRIINFHDEHIVIECEDSSVATIIRFDREKYLKLINDSGLFQVNDIKVKVKTR